MRTQRPIDKRRSGKRFQVRWVDRTGRERVYAQSDNHDAARGMLEQGQQEYVDQPVIARSFVLVDITADSAGMPELPASGMPERGEG